MDTLEPQVKGWERRGIYAEPKLTQISEMYEELGFLVMLKPFNPEIEAGCTECIKENPDEYKVLYTKKMTLNKKN